MLIKGINREYNVYQSTLNYNAFCKHDSTVLNNFKVAQNSNISMKSLGSNAHLSARHHAIAR